MEDFVETMPVDPERYGSATPDLVRVALDVLPGAYIVSTVNLNATVGRGYETKVVDQVNGHVIHRLERWYPHRFAALNGHREIVRSLS